MRIVIQDGVDHRKAVIVGLSFWFGAAFQNGWVFPELLGDGFLGVLLGNGMTSGAIVAVIMMVFIELTSLRRRRLTAALPELAEFLRGLASKAGWNAESAERLVLVGEETLSTLLSEEDGDSPGSEARRLVVTARTGSGGAELEFLSAHEGEISRTGWRYGETPDVQDGREYRSAAASLRVIGPPSEVPRRRHSYGERRRPR